MFTAPCPKGAVNTVHGSGYPFRPIGTWLRRRRLSTELEFGLRDTPPPGGAGLRPTATGPPSLARPRAPSFGVGTLGTWVRGWGGDRPGLEHPRVRHVPKVLRWGFVDVHHMHHW